MTTIEIWWEGPFSADTIKNFTKDEDYGLYQIYGTHNINGPNNLLYLGLANDQNFSTRISQHSSWIDWEYSDIKIFLGRLGGINNNDVKIDDWEKYINHAERLLIYYCKPPYNSKNLNTYGSDITDTIVMNFGQINRLPLEVSSFYNDSKFWTDDWKPYSLQ